MKLALIQAMTKGEKSCCLQHRCAIPEADDGARAGARSCIATDALKPGSSANRKVGCQLPLSSPLALGATLVFWGAFIKACLYIPSVSAKLPVHLLLLHLATRHPGGFSQLGSYTAQGIASASGNREDSVRYPTKGMPQIRLMLKIQ